MLKIFNFYSEIILGNYLDIWQVFSGHTDSEVWWRYRPLYQLSHNHCQIILAVNTLNGDVSGQSYEASTIVIYNSRVVPDLKIPHITTLEL